MSLSGYILSNNKLCNKKIISDINWEPNLSELTKFTQIWPTHCHNNISKIISKDIIFIATDYMFTQ